MNMRLGECRKTGRRYCSPQNEAKHFPSLNTRNVTVRSVVYLLLSALVSGCVPIPNRHYFAPKIHGTLLREGAPVSGAVVDLVAAFTDETSASITDEKGRFMLPALKEWRFGAILIGDPLYEFELRVQIEGAEITAFKLSGIGYAEDEVRVVCELARPLDQKNGSQLCVANGDERLEHEL